jgi:hypothetical protein
MTSDGDHALLIAIRGGVAGAGKTVPAQSAGIPGRIALSAKSSAALVGVSLQTLVLEPGYTSTSVITSALRILDTGSPEPTRLILYGYSRGGDSVVDLAQALQYRRMRVDLIFTIDAAFGPLSVSYLSPVDRVIPGNVDVNLNYFQSTAGSPSDDDAMPDLPTSTRDRADIVGSRGAPNRAASRGTRVYNVEVFGTRHTAMDDYTEQAVVLQLQSFLRCGRNGHAWSPLPLLTAGL